MSPRTPTPRTRRSSLLIVLTGSALVAAGLANLSGCRDERPSSMTNPDAGASSLAPMSPALTAKLRATTHLYWRHPRDGAVVCEPWTLRWSDEENTRALLEHDEPGPPPATLRLALNLADDQLYARSPEIERSGDLRTLPCVFSGQVDLRGGSAEGLDLDSRARWYVDADACRSDDPKGRIQPLGCPATLADLPSRARLLQPPGDAPTRPPPWLLARRVFLQIEDEGEGSRCLPLRREAGPEGDHHGLLRGPLGPWAIELRYHFDGRWLTLSGPTWRQRRGREERVVSRGCLFAEELSASDSAGARFPRVGWYVDRDACERAAALRTTPRCIVEAPASP